MRISKPITNRLRRTIAYQRCTESFCCPVGRECAIGHTGAHDATRSVQPAKLDVGHDPDASGRPIFRYFALSATRKKPGGPIRFILGRPAYLETSSTTWPSGSYRYT